MANEAPDRVKPDTEDNEKLHNWCIGLVEDGESRKNGLEGQWWENIATYMGDFWSEWDPHKRRLWEPVPKAEARVRIPINLAQPAVRTEFAKLSKNRPITDVMAAGPDLKNRNSAKVGNKMLNQYVEKKFSMPKVRRRALSWLSLCGTAGLFLDWDDNAEAGIQVYALNGEPIVDQRAIRAYQQRKKKGKGEDLKKMELKQGEFIIKELSPFQMIWDFSQIYLEDAGWMIITDIYDTNTIKRRWGKQVSGENDVEPGVIERRLLSKLDVTQSLTAKSPDNQELAKVHRLYVRPGHPYFPKGAHIVFTPQEIIHKENYPYKHGRLPVRAMGHIPMPTAQFDMSILPQIRGPVLELSRTESQMLENRNMASNPPWLIPTQVRLEKPITNKAGLRIKYTHVPNVPPPQPIQMPDLPQYVKDLPEALRQFIQDISGQSDVSTGQVPPGARSGVAIAYLEEIDDTKIGPTVQEYEECIEGFSWDIIETMAEKYAIPRTVTIYRKHGDPEVFDFYGEMLSGCAGVEVQAGSALPRSKAAKQQFILDLWDRKLEQDPRKVREMLELSEGEPEDFELDLDQAERENKRLQQGQPVEVKDWHNHNAHLYKHNQFRKSAEYEALAEEVKAAYDAHCDQHDFYLKQQQMEVQMMQEGAEGKGPGAGFGQQRPEGAPPQFTSEETPRSLMADEPQ